MTMSRLRPAFLALILFLALGMLAFAFSPTVRAAVQTLFSINGVNVIADQITGELTTEGNKDAVVFENGRMVVIEGGGQTILFDEIDARVSLGLRYDVGPYDPLIDDMIAEMKASLEAELAEAPPAKSVIISDGVVDGEQMREFSERNPFNEFAPGMAVVGGSGGDFATLDEIMMANPNFVVPTDLPKGYTLDYGFMNDDGLVGLAWFKGEEMIAYSWGEPTLPEFSEEEKAVLAENDLEYLDDRNLVLTEGFEKIAGFAVTLSGRTDDGVFYTVIASDTSLTEADLELIAP